MIALVNIERLRKFQIKSDEENRRREMVGRFLRAANEVGKIMKTVHTAVGAGKTFVSFEQMQRK